MVMREGLVLANRLRCNNILAESNSMEVIEAFLGNEARWGEWNHHSVCGLYQLTNAYWLFEVSILSEGSK
jgi:hypothetical protein